MTGPQQHYRDTFERIHDRLTGTDIPWLEHMRSAALAEFLRQPLPDTRNEDWKYTDLRSFNRHLFTPSEQTKDRIDPQPWLFDGTPMHRLVFVDGHHVSELSTLHPPPGVTLTTLATELARRPASLEPVLGHTPARDQAGFDALNHAFMQDGVCLRLERGATLELPVLLLFISTGKAEAMQTLRNVIEAGPGSAATVIESWVTLGDGATLTNTVTEVTLDEAAAVDHYTLIQEGAGTAHLGALYVHQKRDSRLAAHNFTLGGRLVRNTLRVGLDGAGAQCLLNGLAVTHGRQHVDNHTRIDHLQPHATSNEWYKGILAERSRVVFSGRIVVQAGAQKSVAQQSNRSLLLSADAEADARPQFEIHADDVQCSHGCTVGELDPDALFYLRTRGLDEHTARGMLVHAFAADVFERVPLEPLRRYLERALKERLLLTHDLQMEGRLQ